MDVDMDGRGDRGGLAPSEAGDERGKLRALLLDYGAHWEIEQVPRGWPAPATARSPM